MAKKAAAGATELGQWTKEMGMDAVVAGLVNVCTAAAGTARAKEGDWGQRRGFRWAQPRVR